ncbi:MAG: hypothetical protein ABI700_29270 [Chloroflexota bacterium]
MIFLTLRETRIPYTPVLPFARFRSGKLARYSRLFAITHGRTVRSGRHSAAFLLLSSPSTGRELLPSFPLQVAPAT